MASRTPFFDLPPWGIALCLLLAACLAGAVFLPGLCADLTRNETTEGEPFQALLPGREGETQLSYDPGLERMTVAVFPGPATTSLTLAVARQPNPNEPPILLYLCGVEGAEREDFLRKGGGESGAPSSLSRRTGILYAGGGST